MHLLESSDFSLLSHPTDNMTDSRKQKLPLSSSLPRLPSVTHEVPYPYSPRPSHFSHSRQSSLDPTKHMPEQRSKSHLLQFLDSQREEKAKKQRELLDLDRQEDLQAIARWNMELQAEKQQEMLVKQRKREARVKLEREYAKEYKARVTKAVTERAAEEAQVIRMIRQAQDDVKRQAEVKAGLKRMFQDLIHVNEQQKRQAIIQYEAELRKDALMQRELVQKLARQDEARKQALKERIRKQQFFLLGEAVPEGFEGKQRDQMLYRKVLDRQVKEHMDRDVRNWRKVRAQSDQWTNDTKQI